MSKGTTFYEISTFLLSNVKIPIPPLKEQKEIAKSLKKELKFIENSIKCTIQDIDLIHEYRTRIISDVVTGNLDIRSVEIKKESVEDMREIVNTSRFEENCENDEKIGLNIE
jgi:type I restriction enzyme S subunit